MNYKNKYSFYDRLKESTTIIQKYPYKIPIICERHSKSDNIPAIKKNKYLVPFDFSVGNFLYTIRQNIQIPSEIALYLLIDNNTIPPTTTSMINLYENYKDADGFLYISYLTENTFG